MKYGLNLGSGQRRFESTPEVEWCNVDIVSRPPDQVPDLVCEIKDLPRELGHGRADYVVCHHICEHWGLGEFPWSVCYQLLKPGGSLLVFVPDMKALATRWLQGLISDYIFFVNTYGAFQGLESDRHRWGFTEESLAREISDSASWSTVRRFNWRTIPNGNFSRDWWILDMEAIR